MSGVDGRKDFRAMLSVKKKLIPSPMFS